MEANTLNLPVLALRGLTVFPHTNLTFDVERRISIKALEVAMESGQEIFLVTQRELNTDRPGEKDLYTMGTISRVTQILRLGKTSLRVMVEGGRRARLRRLWQTEPYLQGHVEVVEESAAVSHGPKTEALLRQTWGLFQDYAHLAGNVAEEVTAAVLDCQEPGYLADFIAQNTALRYDDKQAILEELSPLVRLRKLNGFLARERDVLGYERQMEGKVRDELAQQQKEQILRTQIRVLQNELGEDEDNEIEEYRRDPGASGKGDQQAGKAALCQRGGFGDPELSGRVSGTALGYIYEGASECGRGPEGAGPGSLRSGKGEGADFGDHCRPADESGGEGADHLSGRPPGRG